MTIQYEMINHPKRGTGRSTRLLNALPEGGIYVIHHDRLRNYFYDYLRSIGKENITVVCIDRLEHAIRGLTVPVGIDHVCCNAIYDDDYVKTILLRVPELYYNDPDGNVIVRRLRKGKFVEERLTDD